MEQEGPPPTDYIILNKKRSVQNLRKVKYKRNGKEREKKLLQML